MIDRRSAAELEVQRRAIVAKYARLLSSGRPQFCRPGKVELTGRRKQGPRTDGKVIYPDRVTARAAADELEVLYGRALLEFPCQRSRHGHFHLATDQAALRREQKR